MRFKLMTLCKLLKFLISSKQNLSKLNVICRDGCIVNPKLTI